MKIHNLFEVKQRNIYRILVVTRYKTIYNALFLGIRYIEIKNRTYKKFTGRTGRKPA